ncbi:acetyl/propionyl/methylcrotonyl-CoA carboxylase subunit alpha [Xanthobacter autotrophicus]|uniref:acetyl/propionyl/methylcrotonyl-CoA carboxylase subunit alpha n=1 Tax=Xanthobacter TaxID=279 RepID=UPI0024AB36EB|nr:acetyl/propionyl/methylcrotonyl-CoA carboxylase subunit alpha [Xanthobacter autotrophicus]MDI4666548.1 acetyl/propionyl/methylcrotonyl-CoA carboxylase subunit alpha [Xanthobacter autotrophicus]
MTRAIRTLLVANRGEIAVRVMRTAKAMGIRTVAVYSQADADALHVATADEAYPIGPAPARDSYLRIEAILDAARKSGADAIHPGYGFLSENAAFAEACEKAGIVFVGPPAAAIRAMGSKSAAKALMDMAGVPLVPGYHGEDQDAGLLAREAERIGFPVLIKASAGGGGKGMKVVRSAEDFPDALASAQREAKSAFGDDRVLVEKYLTTPRHIEVQVFADSHGNAVYLHERDCSIQRRHQKVVEEAPAPGMTAERRAAMGKAAVDAARAVGYRGAGTVEFIAEGEHFYFMEMNTRLQVEHPVTESITGQDLVEWQIRVAEGETLPLAQADIPLKGHAIEVRLYAEDPARDFLPQVGRLDHLVLPSHLQGTRVDTGVRSGDTVSIHYDPMIAKIIVSGADRTEAVRRLDAALAATEVVGLATNRVFLKAIAAHPAFAAAELDTNFIARHQDQLLPPPRPVDDTVLALAALSILKEEARQSAEAVDAADPWSPWGLAPGWRLNRDAHVDLTFADRERRITVRAHFRPAGFILSLPCGDMSVEGDAEADGTIRARLDGVALSARVIRSGAHLTVFVRGGEYGVEFIDPRLASQAATGTAGRLVAPMPGTIIRIAVEEGQEVAKGAALVVVEAMKMEHTVAAPRDGKVKALKFAVGDLVDEGAELLVLEDA